ncbi:Hypothetical predicted protein [Paramuricea clavata]|uniref:Uncharacterized protein n=1 Tax=Paramuricea clavata TaxID=317549 RepID=A0A7D9M047_PARCT|nr:Hypothetical predicted protein [Paramuricea clavata]
MLLEDLARSMTSEPDRGEIDEDDLVFTTPPSPSVPQSSSSQGSESTITLTSPIGGNTPPSSSQYPPSPSVPEASNSQGTESTITLSFPSQDSEANDDVISVTSASVECQTNDGIFLSKEEYEELIQKSAEIFDIKGDLEKLKTHFLAYDPQPPVMDPNQFEEICMQAGAGKLFSTLHMAMSSNRMSDERQGLTKL